MIGSRWKSKISGTIFEIESIHKSGWMKGTVLKEDPKKKKMVPKDRDHIHLHQSILEKYCEPYK